MHDHSDERDPDHDHGDEDRHEHHGHHHEHAVSGSKLPITIGILSITFLAELIGGLAFGSLSLVSDSAHVFSDLLSLALAFGALRIALSRQPSDRMTYGYHRLEIMSAILNGAMLVVVSIYILFEAYERYQNPQEIQAFSAMLIAIVGFVVNLVSMLVLRSDVHHREDLNLRSAYLHLLGDAGASVAVIVGMLTIQFTNYTIVDPLLAAGISLLILYSAIRVLAEGTGILMQRSPADPEQILELIREIDGVVDFADVRMWLVCSHIGVCTAHVVTSVETLEETERIGSQIREILRREAGIRHATLQFETEAMSERHSHDLDHQH